jgi:hypothetical protein
VPAVVCHPRDALDQEGHSGQRPAVKRHSRGLGGSTQRAVYLGEGRRAQLHRASGPNGGEFAAPPHPKPPGGCSARHAESTRRLRATDSLPEQVEGDCTDLGATGTHLLILARKAASAMLQSSATECACRKEPAARTLPHLSRRQA